MAREITQEIYRMLHEVERVTAAGVCHLMDADPKFAVESPPNFDEASRSLDWLARNGYVVRHPDQGLGPEYTLRKAT